MITFINPRDAGGDLTQWDIKFDQLYTLDMFLNEIKDRKNRGYIDVVFSGRRYMTFSYDHKDINIPLCKELKRIPIQSAIATSCWDAIDYILCV